MATVKQFEDLVCWQKARELTKFIYDISKFRYFDMDYGLKDQIRRAAVSVMSNIAEGFDRGTKAELVHFFFIAKASAGEVKSQLYISYDLKYVDISAFRHGLDLCDDCSRLIRSFIFKVKSGGSAGSQFKTEKSKRQREMEAFQNKTLEDMKKSNPKLYEMYYKQEHERKKQEWGIQ